MGKGEEGGQAAALLWCLVVYLAPSAGADLMLSAEMCARASGTVVKMKTSK